MPKAARGEFTDTVIDAPEPVVAPLTAGRINRAIYCLALAALVVGSIGQTASWIGLATGGGLIGFLGGWGFLLVAAAVIYRIYRVVRYPEALDARPPYLLGWLLRGLGWIVMLAGAMGFAAMFLVKPLTLLLFKTAGENGIGFFVVGLYATMLAGVGWLGCVVFDISRAVGKRVSPASPRRSRRQLLQDRSVFVALAVAALALPRVTGLIRGEPCYGPSLGKCAAKVEGGVSRLAMAPLDAPVGLQSNIESIEYKQSHGKSWTVSEEPGFSLLKSGHPVANAPGAEVNVILNAAEDSKGVVLDLRVTEKGQPTAEFKTRYSGNAKLEPAADGKRKLVIALGRNVESHNFRAQTADGRNLLLDEVYQQVRASIGSEREVSELSRRIEITATFLPSTALPPGAKFKEKWPAENCKGKLKIGAGNAERGPGPMLAGISFPLASFQVPEGTTKTALTSANDSVSCHDGAFWFATALFPPKDSKRSRFLQVRRYDAAGDLDRHWLVALPPEKDDQKFEYVDPESLLERDGRLEFKSLVITNDGKPREQRFSAKL